MNLEEIIEMVKDPINEMVSDKMLHNDYRKISKESNATFYTMRNNDYDLLIWYDNPTDTSISIKIHGSGLTQLRLAENDVPIIKRTLNKSKVSKYILMYFIESVKVHMDYKDKMLEMRSNLENPPKDFVRDLRLKDVLNG